MLNNANELQVNKTVLNRLRQLTTKHMIVACRARMSNYEIALCQEISTISKLPLIDVLEKMEIFKQTSAHILYKKDFIFV